MIEENHVSNKRNVNSTTGYERYFAFQQPKDIMYSCCICKFSSEELPRMERHCYRCRSENGYCCFCCHRSFISRSALKTHVLLHSNQRPISCPRCRKTFCTITKLMSHLENHFKKILKKIIICNSCKEKFMTKKHYYLHIDKCPVPEEPNNFAITNS